MRSLRSLAAVAVVALAAVGCTPPGPALHPTRGKVLVNKQPAAGALVVFHPKGGAADALRPSAVTADDGTFEVGCGAVGAGAPAGEYDVTVIWDPASPTVQGKVGGMGGGESKQNGDKLGGRYAAVGKSGLTARVEAKTNDLPAFELK